MTALALHLASFLREHLPKERRASQHTCEAYAQSFQLLLGSPPPGSRSRQPR